MSPTGQDSSLRLVWPQVLLICLTLSISLQALESANLKELITTVGSGVGAAPAAGAAPAGGAAPAADAPAAKKEEKKEESEEEDDDMGFGLFD